MSLIKISGRFVGFVLFAAVPLVLPLFGQTTTQNPENHFVLILPELGDREYDSDAIVNIPGTGLSQIEVIIKKPIADQVDYGKIAVFVNGEPVDSFGEKFTLPEGKLVKIDLKSMPRVLLRKGRNSVEALAELNTGSELYATYVLSAPYKESGAVYNSASGAEKFTGKKYALIIGISRYINNDPLIRNLRFADADAREFRDFLLSPQGGGFTAENVKLIENGAATLSAVKGALDEYLNKAGPEDLLVFFLAGHGGPDPKRPKLRYFWTSDTRSSDMAKTALLMTYLRDRLTKDLRAKRMVSFIDTCHSAGFGGEDKRKIGMRGVGVNLVNQDFENFLYRAEGMGVLTSSDIEESSYEDERWNNHGVFTYYLLRGLKGEADFDKDKIVTAGELFEFTRDNVPKAVDDFIGNLKEQGYSGQHPRAAIGNNDRLQLSTVPSALNAKPASKRGK